MTDKQKRTYVRLDFSSEQEEKLIEYVQSHSVLYNVKDEMYKNKQYRDRLWGEFGDTINKPGIFRIEFQIYQFMTHNNIHLSVHSFIILQDWNVVENGLISKIHILNKPKKWELAVQHGPK